MKILLAEDSGVTRRLFAAAIAEGGHDVVQVEHGQAAWEAFEREPVPLVILDWVMPILDGLEVCRRIRASAVGRDTFVLVVTGRGAAEDVTSALDAGADDFIAKPVTAAHLRARLSIAARRIEQNAARRRAEEELARARWLAGIGETTLTLQHEINNPLTVLIAECELLVDEPDLPAAHRSQVATVTEQARRIARVITRLSTMDDPRTVEYIAGMRMLDLSDGARPMTARGSLPDP